MGSADLVLFAIDAQVGITPRDEEIAKMLREQKFGREQSDGSNPVPVVMVATKIDGPKWRTATSSRASASASRS